MIASVGNAVRARVPPRGKTPPTSQDTPDSAPFSSAVLVSSVSSPPPPSSSLDCAVVSWSFLLSCGKVDSCVGVVFLGRFLLQGGYLGEILFFFFNAAGAGKLYPLRERLCATQ